MKLNFKKEARNQEQGASSLAAALSSYSFLLSPAGARARARGIALVITLILLAVTLVMAVAFLAVARRERNAVTTTTDTATARLAADSALAAAQSQIAATILATTASAYNFSLVVSTNYISGAGYDIAVGANLTNVNYNYPNGNPIFGNDLIQNIANLWFLPRAPVFVYNRNTGSNDFRFYLDLNRNGVFEPNNPAYTTAGDPEWIGVLERPDQPHGPNNHFVARYAFLAAPVGNALDLNYIYNESGLRAVDAFAGQSGARDSFFRNQGVGSWEINLAAFLADLNVTQWGQVVGSGAGAPVGSANFYQYNWPLSGTANSGHAFDDARSLLSWRYGFSYFNLNNANALFANAANFQNDNIDEYSDGPLQTTLNTNADNDIASLPWAGADNTNRFFSLPSDLFDPNKSSAAFTNRLMGAGNSPTNYDRYTFYRMLEQLGTDSDADGGKMNLNYRNVTNGVVVPGMETNLYVWTPLEFFTNAADRMLRLYTTNWFAANPTNYLRIYYGVIPNRYIGSDGFGLTNFPYFGATNQIPAFDITRIPVQINDSFVYSPAINRLLQLAANIYDASTTNTFPSVFRPTFLVTNENGFKNVYINGYEEVSSLPSLSIGAAPLDYPISITAPGLPFGVLSGLLTANHNIFGVPWIIGAKKGFPAFNQFTMINQAQVTRKLEVSRPSSDQRVNQTNQQYTMSITNNVGLSFWNSYNNNYPRPLTVYAQDSLTMVLTNGLTTWTGTTNLIFSPPTIASWPGANWSTKPMVPDRTANGGALAVNWSFPFLTETFYSARTGTFPSATGWEPLTPLNYRGNLGLSTTNYIQAMILDGNHVVDYVQLRDPVISTNLDAVLADPDYPDSPFKIGKLMWSTNLFNGSVEYGTQNQIDISIANKDLPQNTRWVQPVNYPVSGSIGDQVTFFNYFINSISVTNADLTVQAPYTPSRIVYSSFLLQANDPLVHYLASDLNSQPGASSVWDGKQSFKNGVWNQIDDWLSASKPVPPANPVDGRYQPWGAVRQLFTVSSVDTNGYNLAFRDSLVWGSDYWDFPANRYPTAGWLGRVHRGTPWQTVFLKSTNILQAAASVGNQVQNVGLNTWAQWTGDIQIVNNQYYDAINASPLQDRLLFDLFTTAPNDNATHGQLSVNQTHLAAWSAVLSGMVALTNNESRLINLPSYTFTVINPAGIDAVNSPLAQIVNGASGINATRANASLFPSGVFSHVGDILLTPALTAQSPFLNQLPVGNTLTATQIKQKGISDEVYEWLPQQMMGLLKCPVAPRYVVYCYGQTLKPAPDGTVLSPTQFGLITNYQVTAESAARVVLRVDRHATATGTNYTTTVESYNPLPPD
jgi:hypothetical protein